MERKSICKFGYKPELIREELLKEAKDRNFEGYESLSTIDLYRILTNPLFIPSNVWIKPCNSITKGKINTESDRIASYSAFSLSELREIAYKNGFSNYMTLQRHELLKLLLKSNVNLF